MMKTKDGPPPKSLAVLVRRDLDGQVFSEVVDRNRPTPWPNRFVGVVIDRRSRMMDVDTITRRAESLAQLIGAELDVDLSWQCRANQKLRCRCPDCIKAGRDY